MARRLHIDGLGMYNNLGRREEEKTSTVEIRSMIYCSSDLNDVDVRYGHH